MDETPPRYWRVRVKVGNSDDFTKDAWDHDEVGVWYGAWSASYALNGR